MYPRPAITRLIRLVQSGLLDLHHFQPTESNLDHANNAVAHAATTARPFHLAILRP